VLGNFYDYMKRLFLHTQRFFGELFKNLPELPTELKQALNFID